MSLLKPLRSFRERMAGKSNPDEVHIRRTDIQRTSAALADVVFMADSFYDKSEYNVRKSKKVYKPANALKHDAPSSPIFQNIARHLKLMDATFDVATSPRAIHAEGTAAADQLSFEVDASNGKFVDKAFEQISVIIKLAWKALEMLFGNNRVSEEYFAQQEGWMNPGIMDQIAYPVGAAAAFNKLISDNKVLLENKVDIKIIDKFIELIR